VKEEAITGRFQKPNKELKSKISFGLSQFLCPLKRPLRKLANSFYRELDKHPQK